MLGSSEQPLSSAYDVAVLDLDGVVYVGPDAVEGAPEALNRAQSSRHAPRVRDQQRRPPTGDRGGAPARPRGRRARRGRRHQRPGRGAAARRPAADREPGVPDRWCRGSRRRCASVAWCRSPSRRTRCRGRARATARRCRGSGWSRASILVRAGLPWVASNTDMTHPDRDGGRAGQRHPGAAGRGVRRPGAGGGRQADAAAVRGDPGPGRRRASAGGRGPAGHRHRGCGHDGLGQPAGAHRRDRARGAGPGEHGRAADLHRPRPGRAGRGAGVARARPTSGVSWAAGPPPWTAARCDVSGSGSAGDWWRVVAVAAWGHLDETGQPVATDGVEPPR